jgi:hypothetical protein
MYSITQQGMSERKGEERERGWKGASYLGEMAE